MLNVQGYTSLRYGPQRQALMKQHAYNVLVFKLCMCYGEVEPEQTMHNLKSLQFKHGGFVHCT